MTAAEELSAGGSAAGELSAERPERTAAALPDVPRLDDRLMAAARLVPPGARVADVGCDHGKLSVYLALSGQARRVLAVDIRPQPLERARQLVEKTGCGQLVECRLSDGLSCVLPGEADAVVLAGISGVTAVQILAAAPWVQDAAVRVIAVPPNKPEVLRRWLWETGFAIETECAALVDGYPYPVLAACWCGQPRTPTEAECRLGLLAEDTSVAAAAYRRKVLRQVERCLAGMRTGAREDRYSQRQLEEMAALRDAIKAKG